MLYCGNALRSPRDFAVDNLSTVALFALTLSRAQFNQSIVFRDPSVKTRSPRGKVRSCCDSENGKVKTPFLALDEASGGVLGSAQ